MQRSICADRFNRGTRFVLSRDELLTLPEFVLLSLFPNGLFPEGHMGSGFADGDAVHVDVRAPLPAPNFGPPRDGWGAKHPQCTP